MSKFYIFIVFVAMSFSAHASWHRSKIATIHTYLNGLVVIYTVDAHDCGSNQINLDNTKPGFDRMYSALLAYEAQSKDVKFSVTCTNGVTTGTTDRVISVN